jgi:hypothetical protein
MKAKVELPRTAGFISAENRVTVEGIKKRCELKRDIKNSTLDVY